MQHHINTCYVIHWYGWCTIVTDNYYDEDMTEEGPSVSSIIRDHVTKMTDTMRENVTTKTMLDVESKVSIVLSIAYMY